MIYNDESPARISRIVSLVADEHYDCPSQSIVNDSLRLFLFRSRAGFRLPPPRRRRRRQPSCQE